MSLDRLDGVLGDVARRALEHDELSPEARRWQGIDPLVPEPGHEAEHARLTEPQPALMQAPFFLVRSMPAAGPGECQGRGCHRAWTAGDPIHCVAHRRRATAEPNSPDARAWLCQPCVDRLGPRLDRPTTVYTRVQVATNGGEPSW